MLAPPRRERNCSNRESLASGELLDVDDFDGSNLFDDKPVEGRVDIRVGGVLEVAGSLPIRVPIRRERDRPGEDDDRVPNVERVEGRV